jgi:hypothetical protein
MTRQPVEGRNMKPILYGLGLVALVLGAGVALVVSMLAWFSGCDLIYHRGHPVLATCLTPMAFIGYALLVALFLFGYKAAK